VDTVSPAASLDPIFDGSHLHKGTRLDRNQVHFSIRLNFNANLKTGDKRPFHCALYIGLCEPGEPICPAPVGHFSGERPKLGGLPTGSFRRGLKRCGQAAFTSRDEGQRQARCAYTPVKRANLPNLLVTPQTCLPFPVTCATRRQ